MADIKAYAEYKARVKTKAQNLFEAWRSAHVGKRGKAFMEDFIPEAMKELGACPKAMPGDKPTLCFARLADQVQYNEGSCYLNSHDKLQLIMDTLAKMVTSPFNPSDYVVDEVDFATLWDVDEMYKADEHKQLLFDYIIPLCAAHRLKGVAANLIRYGTRNTAVVDAVLLHVYGVDHGTSISKEILVEVFGTSGDLWELLRPLPTPPSSRLLGGVQTLQLAEAPPTSA